MNGERKLSEASSGFVIDVCIQSVLLLVLLATCKQQIEIGSSSLIKSEQFSVLFQVMNCREFTKTIIHG